MKINRIDERVWYLASRRITEKVEIKLFVSEIAGHTTLTLAMDML